MMKYVIFEKTIPAYGDYKEEKVFMPVLFPRHIVHATVTIGSKYPVISAGFYDPINHSACGRSDSLGVASIPERDSIILMNAILYPTDDMRFYTTHSCYNNCIARNIEITLDMNLLDNKVEFEYFIEELIKVGFQSKVTYPFGVITGILRNEETYNKLSTFNEIINIKEIK